MVKSITAKLSRPALLLIFFILFCCLSGCGGSIDTGTTPTTPSAASLSISASSPTVPSNESATTTITVRALDSSSGLLSGINIIMTADVGVLGSSSIITDSTGKATVTFESGPGAVDRTATITATSGTASAMIPIQITGSTVTMTPSSAGLDDSGSSSVTLTVRPKNSGGSAVSGATVTMSQTGAGRVTFNPSSGPTVSGVFTTTVTGTSAGAVTVIASALGETATSSITISAVTDTFTIDQQTLDGIIIANNTTSAMKINTPAFPYTPHSLNIRVHAPTGISQVRFVTSIGVWDGGSSKVVTKTVAGNAADATLTSTQTGVAGVQIFDADNPATSDTLTVAMSSGADPTKIMLQASKNNIKVSGGSTIDYSTLTATVSDASNNPLPNWPVAFSIVPGTGTSGGETITPVVAMTTALPSGDLSIGQARASFTSGSMPSGGNGVQIRASVVGSPTVVETEPIGVNLTDSGNDAAIVIGGVAGSIAFGQATVISVDSTKANYVWPMSILVSDSNGNALSGAVVSLSLWPIAWSTGISCMYDYLDGFRWNGDDPATYTAGNYGTFYNEDTNENLILDSGEDGRRYYYANNVNVGPGTLDTYITPRNSDGGSVPSSVTTDANGVAGFNLTYVKESAIWTVVRIRATTTVQGSETRGEIMLRLPALQSDVSPCLLGSSPYTY
jgi:hypothetical protein